MLDRALGLTMKHVYDGHCVRRRSHYSRNDGDGDGEVTFRHSHFTLRNMAMTIDMNVTMAMAATVTVMMTAIEGVIQLCLSKEVSDGS